MAGILFTSYASLRAHHRHGAVMWRVVRQITRHSRRLRSARCWRRMCRHDHWRCSSRFVCVVALQMLLSLKPKPLAQPAWARRR